MDDNLLPLLSASIELAKMRSENARLIQALARLDSRCKFYEAQLREMHARDWRKEQVQREETDWQPERGDLT